MLVNRPPPWLSQHTDEVLEELGYDTNTSRSFGKKALCEEMYGQGFSVKQKPWYTTSHLVLCIFLEAGKYSLALLIQKLLSVFYPPTKLFQRSFAVSLRSIFLHIHHIHPSRSRTKVRYDRVSREGAQRRHRRAQE